MVFGMIFPYMNMRCIDQTHSEVKKKIDVGFLLKRLKHHHQSVQMHGWAYS